jgi:hypothetical protein
MRRIATHLPRILPYVRDGAIVCGIFGVIYFAATLLLQVPEAKATVGRVLRR